jgi:hypothetical protein
MYMLGKTLKQTGLGFLAGIAVGNVITALTAAPDLVAPTLAERLGSVQGAFLVQTLFCGLLGAVSFAGTRYYAIERWSLALSALVHYLTIEAVYVPMGFFLGWFDGPGDALTWMGICAAAYAVVFLILWTVYHAQVRELNKLNDERKQREQKTKIGGDA